MSGPVRPRIRSAHPPDYGERQGVEQAQDDEGGDELEAGIRDHRIGTSPAYGSKNSTLWTFWTSASDHGTRSLESVALCVR